MGQDTLLLRGGRLLDPARGYHGEKKDVLIEKGIITRIGDAVESGQEAAVLELDGAWVAPGFIDIHAHVFDAKGLLGGYELGLPADMIGVAQGVTTVVDAGTVGPATMELFINETVKKSRTRVLSAIHYATEGLKDPPEADDPAKYDLATGLAACEKYKDHIVAIKARASNSCVGKLGIASIRAGKALARAAGLPMLVHIGHMPPRIEEVADLMDKGDIITHAFHGKDNNLLDLEKETIPPSTQAARDRGVLFDVGHGKDSFNINTGKLARRLGFYPDTISTDLHTASFHKPVQSLPETMSKFMALGYTLEEVVDKVTEAPARCLSLEKLGKLQPGCAGDITVFHVEQGDWLFVDANKNELHGRERIVPDYAVVAGRVEMDGHDVFRRLCATARVPEIYWGEYDYMARATLALLEKKGVVIAGDHLAPFLNHLITLLGRLRTDEHLPDMGEEMLEQIDPQALAITDEALKLFTRWYGKPDDTERVLVAIHVQTSMEE